MRCCLNSSTRQGLAAILVVLLGWPCFAQAPSSPPLITLRYREIQQATEFKFRMGERIVARPVGEMSFEYPAGLFPIQGIDPALKTFCVEAMVPIHAGTIYSFSLDPVNKPEHFELPNTLEGRTQADKRVVYIRELYGRYYQEVQASPELAAPAFQTALWELIQERDLPAAESPFNLFTGQFRANYPTEADSPAFVQQAQKYVVSLTGDDASFVSNPVLQGLDFVWLTGLAGLNTPAPQSQLALRSTGTPILGSDAGPGGMGPALGQSEMLPTGIPLGSGGGTPGAGLAGPGGLGFAPGLGGGAGAAGFPFLGQPFATTLDPGNSPAVLLPPNLGTIGQGTQSGPSSQDPPNRPPSTGPDSGPPGSGPSLPNPPLPPGPNTPTGNDPDPKDPPPTVPPGENNPIPAPPAVVLGLIGLGIVAARRWARTRKSTL